MPAEENKATSHRFFELYSSGNFDGASQLVAEDVIVHGFPGLQPGRANYRQVGQMFAGAFPDHQSIVEDQVAEGDRVVTRTTFRGTHMADLQGIPPTGKQIAFSSIMIDRFENGLIAERWVVFDQFGMLQQLGVIPTPEQGH
ncbi:MAG: ester cyclase [Chloroflexota bacterium]|nr:ester cyclase [Chloroflexota bacterium]